MVPKYASTSIAILLRRLCLFRDYEEHTDNMPHLGIAMERSLQERSFREGLIDLIARSVAGGLSKRQDVGGIEGGINDVQTAFSSWDNCMAAVFCKYGAPGA